MKLEKDGTFVFIGDSDEDAVKIRQGYDWTIDDNGKIKILETRSKPNFETILPKLRAGQATNAEQQRILAFLIDRVLK